jgi:hypothetical protein
MAAKTTATAMARATAKKGNHSSNGNAHDTGQQQGKATEQWNSHMAMEAQRQ